MFSLAVIIEDFWRRKRRGRFTYGEIAAAGGVSSDIVVRILNGRVPNPGIGTLDAIDKGLTALEAAVARRGMEAFEEASEAMRGRIEPRRHGDTEKSGTGAGGRLDRITG